MKIGLIDMDNISKKRVSFPNLPLMKLSAYHKKHGDCVDWWLALEKYDLVYKSKVFDFTPEIEYPIYADRVVEGTKEREQKQADFLAAGNMLLPSTHEIIAGAQPEEENTAARWWVKTPNPNYGKPQAEERRG